MTRSTSLESGFVAWQTRGASLARAGRDLDVARPTVGEEDSALSMSAVERSGIQQGMILELAEQIPGRGAVCQY